MMSTAPQGGGGAGGGGGSRGMAAAPQVPLSRVANIVRRSLPPLSEVVADSQIDVVKAPGNRVLARCPFHKGGNERNPSMTIDDAKGVFYCFTCGEGGDVVKFVEKLEDLTYAEAIKELADRYEVDGAESFAGALNGATGGGAWAAQPLPAEQQALVDANAAAANFYLAMRKTRAAQQCAELLMRRGVTNQVAEKFGLGFAADSWDGLAAHLRTSTNVTQGTSIAAGLCKKGDTGRINDLFRNRLIIPIHDATGRVVGLGGRNIDDETADPRSPKYLNSPESPVFQKGKLLFGMHLARGAIRKASKALVVEGYMDAIALHAAGVNYAVACLGTALSEAQIELAAQPIVHDGSGGRNAGSLGAEIRALAPRTVVLALDGDDAGQDAMLSLYQSGAYSRLSAKGIDVRIASLEAPFKDPDEFIQAARKSKAVQPRYAAGRPADVANAMAAAGADFEAQVVERALPWIEWVGMRHLIAPHVKSETSAEFAGVTRQLEGLLNTVPRKVERSLYIRTFSVALAKGDASLAATIAEDLEAALKPTARLESGAGAAALGSSSSSSSSSMPIAALASMDVSLEDLYVWDGSPLRMHFSSTTTCGKVKGRRPPALSEMGLELCEAPARDQAELILLYALLHDERARTLVKGLWQDQTQLSTPERGIMLGLLVGSASTLSGKAVWDEFKREWRGLNAVVTTPFGDPLMALLQRSNDDLRWLSRKWLDAAYEEVPDEGDDGSDVQVLITHLVTSIARDQQRAPSLSKAIDVLSRASALTAELEALGVDATSKDVAGAADSIAAFVADLSEPAEQLRQEQGEVDAPREDADASGPAP